MDLFRYREVRYNSKGLPISRMVIALENEYEGLSPYCHGITYLSGFNPVHSTEERAERDRNEMK